MGNRSSKDNKTPKPNILLRNVDLGGLIKRAAFLYVKTGGIIPPSELEKIDELQTENDMPNNVSDDSLPDKFDQCAYIVDKKIKKIKKEMEQYQRDKQNGGTGDFTDNEIQNKKTEIRIMMKLVRDYDLAEM